MNTSVFPTRILLSVAPALLLVLPAPSLCGQAPPFPTDLVLWLDAGNPPDLHLDTGNAVVRWDSRAASANPLALFPVTTNGKTPPVFQAAVDEFGDNVFFDGGNVLELREETVPGSWEPAVFDTVDGLSVFAVSRGETVDPDNTVNWQRILAWTQNGVALNGVLRAFSYDDGMPVPYPAGEADYYWGTGSVVGVSQVFLGAKLSGENLVNILKDVEIAEVLFYSRGFTGEERTQILAWLNSRHGMSTDRTNPTAGRDPRATELRSLVPIGSGFRIAAAGNTNFFRVNQDVSTNPALSRYVCSEATLERHYQMITPTNDFKMVRVGADFIATDLTLPHDWTVTDPYVEWMRARGIDCHGHVLVWHNGIPSPLSDYTWLDGAWSEAQLRTLFNDHIDEMVSRYTPEGARPDLAGVVKVWDVVNEAVVPAWNWNPATDQWEDTLRSSIWFDGGDGPGGRPGLGPEFIADAFHRAESASGSDEIVLLYNDFHAEEINLKSEAIYKMCADLLARGVPIDGIGLQMHLNLYGLDLDSFKSNIARFRALRDGTFEVHITELDMGIPGLVTREKLEAQGQLFHDIVKAALEAGVQSICTWGLHDIWFGGAIRGFEAGLPFSTEMRLAPETPYPGNIPIDHVSRRLSFIEPKPAFFGMLEALRDHFDSPPPVPFLKSVAVDPGGSIGFGLDLPGAGYVDFLGTSDLQLPPMPVGTEGNWRSWLESGSGPQSYSFTDPGWDAGSPRFWRVVHSPRY